MQQIIKNMAYNYGIQKGLVTKKLSQERTGTSLQELEKVLNSILSTEDTSPGVTAVQAEIKRVLGERFQETLGQINWDTGNVSAASIAADQEEIRKKLKTSADQNQWN